MQCYGLYSLEGICVYISKSYLKEVYGKEKGLWMLKGTQAFFFFLQCLYFGVELNLFIVKLVTFQLYFSLYSTL